MRIASTEARFGWVEVALAMTLALLLAHAGFYWFLTDDAFISFRYARNLSEGHGLVFNPGHERVEGYTNFLWVLILAALHRLGVLPETAAPVLGIAATAGLWGLVVWFAGRGQGPRRPWTALIAPLLLASTRSVAVWSTGGLETRLFEGFMVAGVLRLVIETESRIGGGSRKNIAPLLLAAGTLARPDGFLISCSVLAAAWSWAAAQGRLDPRSAARQLAGYGLLVGAHVAFRLAYYGEWLPNTFHAKVSGAWWSMGFAYLASCALEYAAWLWLPLLIAALVAHAKNGTLVTPILFGAAVVPHALYVAFLGGDHFEYRPLDLYFPLAFLLVADGARSLAARARSAFPTVAYLAAVLAGLVALPAQSHRQFIDRYESRFPGQPWDFPASVRFLRPERDPVYRWPGLRSIGEVHRRLLSRTTAQFVGIRQEEHRMFHERAAAEGKLLAKLVESGKLPSDLHLAISCVGAIPYYSRLRVLDRHGLTDTHVARSHPQVGVRILAHEKGASREYAVSRGVDFWPVDPVHCVFPADSADWLVLVRRARAYATSARAYVADLGEGLYLVGEPLMGPAQARARFPTLEFRPLLEQGTLEPIMRVGAGRLRERLRVRPDDGHLWIALGDALGIADEHAAQVEAYESAAVARPEDPYTWYRLVLAYREVGRKEASAEAARRALSEMERAGDAARLEEFRTQVRRALAQP